MSHLCRYRHVVRVLAVFACTLLGLAASAPAAFAMRMEDPGGSSGASLTFTHTAVTSGMPGWQIAVIAAVATLLVATIAVVVHRVRSAHRGRLVPAA
jgi:hypothetical protein